MPRRFEKRDGDSLYRVVVLREIGQQYEVAIVGYLSGGEEKRALVGKDFPKRLGLTEVSPR